MKNFHNSIIGSGTISSKDVNQDYVFTGTLPKLNANIMMVADGIGSYYRSELASRFVCDNLFKILLEIDDISKVSFDDHFNDLVSKLKFELADSHEDKDLNRCFGTTLIVCLETESQFSIAYVGNGSIYHVRSGFEKVKHLCNVPWNAINLLNPHCVQGEGRSILTRFIAPLATILSATPTIIYIKKDCIGNGDIIFLCSDGIFSNDEIKVGEKDNGDILVYVKKALEELFTMLRSKLQSPDLSNGMLDGAIDQYLKKLQQGKIIDDDASLALLITGRAKNYYSASNLNGECEDED